MPYTYTQIQSSLIKPPKETYIEDFKERLEEGFENSSDWFTIQEETSFGSEEYQDVDARINYVIAAETGEKMSDDFKMLWFRDTSHTVKLGTMFYFNDNYWLCINTEKIKSLTTAVTVKRCNNTLRWMDEKGGIYNVPCTMADPLVRENRDYATTGSAVVNVSGVIEVMVQFNEKTNKIKANQRFLFGNPDNWYCYKIFGAGVNNINLMNTEDFYSSGLIRYSMGGWQLNEDTDDLINGICDVYQNEYVLEVNPSSLTLNVGEQINLSYSLLHNGRYESAEVIWSSSNPLIAEIIDGLVNPKQLGFATITVSLKNNESVFVEIPVNIVGEPNINWEIRVSPKDNFVLESTTKIFETRLYLNNSLSSSSFTYSIVSGGVPSANYVFTSLTGNTFSIENIEKYLSEYLVVRCVSSSYQKDIRILLKGGW
jgi:hypothetical protein